MIDLSEISLWAYAAHVALTFLLGYWYGYVAGRARAERNHIGRNL